MKPYLKYAGRKDKIGDRIASYWREYSDRRLVDLFTGSASVPLFLEAQQALLNDSNPHIVNLHRWVAVGWNDGACDFAPPANVGKGIYSSLRDRFNAQRESGRLSNSLDFYLLNRTGWRGLVRHNSKGEFNVPWGDYKRPKIQSDFASHHALMRGWQFTCEDFSKVAIAPGDFVYADPPYDGDKSAFVGYDGRPFTWERRQELVALLATHRGPVLASDKATERAIALYQGAGFQVETLLVRRAIDSKGDRSPALELLAFKHG